MSIVQEALKKAGGMKDPDAGQGPNKKNFGPVVLLVVFIALLGITIKQFSYSPGTNGTKAGSITAESIYKPISSIDMKTDDSPIAETYTSAPRPKQTRERFPNFVLNGIMELIDGPRAIVNNVIVATGDIISGATVRKIGKDKVVLQKENSIITLGME